MSVHVTAWVYDNAPTDLEVSEMFVLVTLAWHANDDGRGARPSVGCVLRETRLGERTVRRALKSLVGRGLIAVEHDATNTTPTMYCFPLYGGATTAPRNTSRGATVAPQTELGVPSWPVGGAVVAPKPSKNVSTPPLSPPQTTAPQEKNTRRTKIDPAFWPDDKQMAWTVGKGWDGRRIEREVEKFIAHHERNGNLMANWPAAWRTWVLNGIGFDERDAARGVVKRAADWNKGGTGRLVT